MPPISEFSPPRGDDKRGKKEVKYKRAISILKKGDGKRLTKGRILFDKFEFPRLKGLEYLHDEKNDITDYLFVNEPHERFSMYFENGFPIFKVPEDGDRSYFLFEIKNPDRRIKFFCPEKHEKLDTVVWYFYVELFDTRGVGHELPGQIRVSTKAPYVRMMKGKPPFFEILETVKLREAFA
jgi:hypothetical protein